MPRLNIDSLPPAKAQYRRDVKAAIETPPAARAEDGLRARGLSRPSVQASGLIDADKCAALSDVLLAASIGKVITPSLASAVYLRRQRIKLASSLWQFVDECPLPATTFTLVSKDWQVAADGLDVTDPNKPLNGLRSDLNRQGAGSAEGAIFMVVDGEFEPNRKIYPLHVHGVAVGVEMVRCIDSLRGLAKYRRVEASAAVAGIKRPVRIGREPLQYLPHPLTYLLKSYWPCRWAPVDEEQPKERRKRRIPEPYHSQLLLWLDQWRLSDMTLMMGMYVGATGFALSPRKTAE